LIFILFYPKVTPMVGTFLLLAMLFQGGSQTTPKPVIENDRVAVWDVPDSPAVQEFDAVIVSLSGKAVFVPRGATSKTGVKIAGAKSVGQKNAGRFIVIDLKDDPVAPIENTTGYPLAFPRPGSKKILENARVIVWDYTWTSGEATPMHFHDKDVVVVYLDDGDLQSTTPDGQIVVNPYRFGMVKFNLRDRTHTETLIRGKQHAVITELK
jgi:hypothetical protein